MLIGTLNVANIAKRKDLNTKSVVDSTFVIKKKTHSIWGLTENAILSLAPPGWKQKNKKNILVA